MRCPWWCGAENDDPPASTRHERKRLEGREADASVSETQPVRAFPNALLEGADNLPVALNNIKEIPVDISWTYGLGDSNQTSTDEATLVANGEFETLISAICRFVHRAPRIAVACMHAKMPSSRVAWATQVLTRNR